MGSELTKEQKNETAEELLEPHEAGTRSVSSDPKVLLREGLLYAGDGYLRTASRLFERLLREHPQADETTEARKALARARLARGWMLRWHEDERPFMQLGNRLIKQATAAFEKVQPRDLQTAVELAEAYTSLHFQKAGEAAALLEEALKAAIETEMDTALLRRAREARDRCARIAERWAVAPTSSAHDVLIRLLSLFSSLQPAAFQYDSRTCLDADVKHGMCNLGGMSDFVSILGTALGQVPSSKVGGVRWAPRAPSEDELREAGALLHKLVLLVRQCYRCPDVESFNKNFWLTFLPDRLSHLAALIHCKELESDFLRPLLMGNEDQVLDLVAESCTDGHLRYCVRIDRPEEEQKMQIEDAETYPPTHPFKGLRAFVQCSGDKTPYIIGHFALYAAMKVAASGSKRHGAAAVRRLVSLDSDWRSCECGGSVLVLSCFGASGAAGFGRGFDRRIAERFIANRGARSILNSALLDSVGRISNSRFLGTLPVEMWGRMDREEVKDLLELVGVYVSGVCGTEWDEEAMKTDASGGSEHERRSERKPSEHMSTFIRNLCENGNVKEDLVRKMANFKKEGRGDGRQTTSPVWLYVLKQLVRLREKRGGGIEGEGNPVGSIIASALLQWQAEKHDKKEPYKWAAKSEAGREVLSSFAPSKPVVKSCATCGKDATRVLVKDCVRCKRVSYCGKECQKLHWKQHKRECVPAETPSETQTGEAAEQTQQAGAASATAASSSR